MQFIVVGMVDFPEQVYTYENNRFSNQSNFSNSKIEDIRQSDRKEMDPSTLSVKHLQ